jgi:UDP-N-acetylmuramoyl-L-alanyl-D-glutamate--2,6-diaminopimelate ligase
MNSLNLDEYLYESYYFQYPTDIEVTSITFNSKEVIPNSIFVGIKGFKSDGNNYIEEAIKNGASLIVTETLPTKEYKDVGFLIVKNARKALAILSRILFDYPDKKLKLIGVTGTDGKTSTCFITYQLLKELGYKVGLISTTNISVDDTIIPSPYRQSTPDAPILFKLLRECVTNKIEYVVIEATSHALSSYFSRLSKIKFDCSIITTITEEHLDFHKNLESYIKTKLKIISKLKDDGTLILTKKNPYLDRCLDKAKKLNKQYFIVEDSINYQINELNTISPISVNIKKKVYQTNFYLPILISNAMLSCLAINQLTNVKLKKIYNKIQHIESIKGRFNIIENNINRTVIIDFAHTSDAFEKVFSYLSSFNKNIIALFGSGGERDLNKRAKMGAIAAQYCSTIILSEEDPRYEDNNKIMKDIEIGINTTKNNVTLIKINNRKDAIKKAFELSSPNDILIFLGKGHEQSIERENIKFPYDEEKTIKEVIKTIYG